MTTLCKVPYISVCLLFLCSFSTFASGIKYGDGNHFQAVKWYPEYIHGNGEELIIRTLFDNFCANGFSKTVEHAAGSKPIFCRTAEAREGQNTHNTHQHEHGHKHKHKHKNNVNAISSEEILHVVLLQEPLSWMLQRLAAETRRSDLLTSQATTGSATLSSKHDHTQSNLPLLTEADDDNKLFTTWGKEYLRFLEISHDGDVKGAGRLRQLANECFESNVKDAHIEGGNIQAQYSNKNKTLLLKDSNTQQTTQRSRTKNTLHSSLVITTQLESILNRPNTIILIQEYVEESLQILNHVFGTSYFHLPSDTASSEQNHAAAAVSVSSTSVGSPLAVKNTAAQLELHQLLYQETLRQFLRHYFAMTHIGA